MNPGEDDLKAASTDGYSRSDEQVTTFLADLEASGLLEDGSMPCRTGDGAGNDFKVDPGSAEHGASCYVVENKSNNVHDTKENMNEIEWLPVLHEESGEYYYWNVQTGITTWEKPVIWNQETVDVSSAEEKTKAAETLAAEGKPVSPVVKNSISEMEPVTLELRSSVEGKDCHKQLATELGNLEILLPHLEGQIAEQSDVRMTEDAMLPNSVLGQELEGTSGVETMLEEGYKQLGSFLDGVTGTMVIQPQNIVPDAGAVESIASEKFEDELGNIREGEMEGYPPEPPVPGLPCSELSVSGKASPSVKENKFGGQEVGLEQEELMKRSEIVSEKVDDKGNQLLQERGIAVVQWGETLKQRLNALAGDTLLAVPARTRLAIEAETRISDCKSFLSLGPMPDSIWLHMEAQLKCLESLLSVDEVAAVAELEQQKLLEPMAKENISATFVPFREGVLPTFGHHEIVAVDACLHQPETITVLYGNNSGEIEEGEIQHSHIKVSEKLLDPEQVDFGESQGKEQKFMDRVEADKPVSGEVSSFGDPDLDMEVDMEVDEETGSETTVPGVGLPFANDVSVDSHVGYGLSISDTYAVPSSLNSDLGPPPMLPPSDFLPPVLSGQPFPISFAPDAWALPPPPPPDDEWAPPPPDDSEVIPPPPPEEPPPLPPPSPHEATYKVEPVPLPPYGDYHASEYVPSEYNVSDYVSEHLPTTDYLPLPNCTFYPVVANAETVGNGVYAGDSAAMSFSEGTGTLELTAGMQASGLSETCIASFNIMPEASAPATSTVVSASTVGCTSNLNAKKVAKGKGTKKRAHSVVVAPMLRTNKKVSSLVSKWKQAKEELHGNDEDEDED
eukprot:c19286_g1_i1 orf=189-2726(+)